jgi:amino acid transporter
MTWGDIKHFLVGKAKDPKDPTIFRRISLIALLAWVGLGADGLTSACYGPEEAYVILNANSFLNIYVAVATILTIAVISLSYSQIIELFPFGGGGYLVATKLINPSAGLVAGSALVIDYILTVAVSVTGGINAFFSFLPMEYQSYKFLAAVLIVGLLILLNLRGVKESITILVPIFMIFIATHLVFLLVALIQKSSVIPSYIDQTGIQTGEAIRNIGVWGIILLILKSFSHGAGTFTGIEAVSNAMPTLREPKVHTGKTAMLYMAVSLALLSGGLLIFYGLFGIVKEPGKTLNASLFESIVAAWNSPFGTWLVILTMFSEAALLFVAAQTGFIGGPQVMANMALDYWLPRRFTNLSERLTVSNGIIFMGLSAIGVMAIAKGQISFLIVLYSINVFITFTLSQFGMCRHWLQVRKAKGVWRNKFLISSVGFLLTLTVLVILIGFKFFEGGWLTLVITAGFVFLAIVVKKHYSATRRALKRLDDILVNVPRPEKPAAIPEKLAVGEPTAVILAGSFNGFGVHTFFSVEKLFPKIFKRYVFVSVGELDTGRFKGIGEVENLRKSTEEAMKKYVKMANDFGFYAESRCDVSVDTIETLIDICTKLNGEYPQTVFFVNKLVFKNENMLTSFLHNDTAFRLHRRLALEGKQLVVMPVRVY